MSGDNAYVHWCAYVLPLCVELCASVVVVARLLTSYWQRAGCMRRLHAAADKPTPAHTTGVRVSQSTCKYNDNKWSN